MVISAKEAIENKYKELEDISAKIDAQIVENIDVRDSMKSFDVSLIGSFSTDTIETLKSWYEKSGWNILVRPTSQCKFEVERTTLCFSPAAQSSYLDVVRDRIFEISKEGTLDYYENGIVEDLYQKLIIAAGRTPPNIPIHNTISEALKKVPDNVKQIFEDDFELKVVNG